MNVEPFILLLLAIYIDTLDSSHHAGKLYCLPGPLLQVKSDRESGKETEKERRAMTAGGANGFKNK